jgi:hypothetical protein
MEVDWFQGVGAESPVVSDAELLLNSFTLRRRVMSPPSGSQGEITKGVLAADKTQCYQPPIVHPSGLPHSRQSGVRGPFFHIVDSYRRHFNHIFLRQLVESKAGLCGDSDKAPAAAIEDIQRVYRLLLERLLRAHILVKSRAKSGDLLAESVWLGREKRHLTVMPSGEDGVFAAVLEDFDGLHIAISNAETKLLAG